MRTIGFSVVGRHVLVYVCDGNERSRRAQTISACFRGRYKGTRIALNGKNGQRLAARVNRRGITGSVRVRKIGKLQRFEFAVKRARGAARFLYGIQPESPPEQSSALPAHGYVAAGWIRLRDGSERGTKFVTVRCTDASKALQDFIVVLNRKISSGGSLSAGDEFTLNFLTGVVAQCIAGTTL